MSIELSNSRASTADSKLSLNLPREQFHSRRALAGDASSTHRSTHRSQQSNAHSETHASRRSSGTFSQRSGIHDQQSPTSSKLDATSSRSMKSSKVSTARSNKSTMRSDGQISAKSSVSQQHFNFATSPERIPLKKEDSISSKVSNFFNMDEYEDFDEEQEELLRRQAASRRPKIPPIRSDEFNNEELKRLARLHVDQRKWLPKHSSGRVITKGTNMLSDVYWMHKDVVFYSDACGWCALLGIVLMVITKEMRFRNQAQLTDNTAADDVDWSFMMVLFANTFVTFLQLLSVWGYYRAAVRTEQLMKTYLSHLRFFWLDSSLIPFLVEIAICSIHEPPLIQQLVDISLGGHEASFGGNSDAQPIYVMNPFALLVFARAYMVMRVVQSRYYTAGTRILGSWSNFDFNYVFTIRNLLANKPLHLLSFAYFATMFICGYSFHVCEREAGPMHSSMFGAFWWVIITVTTVGYGDVYPVTTCGRFVGVLVACLSVVLLTATTTAMYNNLTLFPYEARMLEFIDAEECKNKKFLYATIVIQRAYRVFKNRRANFVQRWFLRRKLALAIHDFHENRLRVMTFTASFQESQFFRWNIERCQMKIDDFVKRFEKVYQIQLDNEAEQKKMAAEKAAWRISEYLELKQEQEEVERQKAEYEKRLYERKVQQVKALQAAKEYAAEVVARQILELKIPKPDIADPLSLLKIAKDAPVVKWVGDTTLASSFGTSDSFTPCTVAEAEKVVWQAHRPPSPIPHLCFGKNEIGRKYFDEYGFKQPEDLLRLQQSQQDDLNGGTMSIPSRSATSFSSASASRPSTMTAGHSNNLKSPLGSRLGSRPATSGSVVGDDIELTEETIVPTVQFCPQCAECYYCRREAENATVQSVHECNACDKRPNYFKPYPYEEDEEDQDENDDGVFPDLGEQKYDAEGNPIRVSSSSSSIRSSAFSATMSMNDRLLASRQSAVSATASVKSRLSSLSASSAAAVVDPTKPDAHGCFPKDLKLPDYSNVIDPKFVALMEDPFGVYEKQQAVLQRKFDEEQAAKKAASGQKDDVMAQLLSGGVKVKKKEARAKGPPILTTALVEGDARMDNFLVLPEPHMQGRLMRLLGNLTSHMHSMNASLQLLQTRVDTSEHTLTEAEAKLAYKRAVIA